MSSRQNLRFVHDRADEIVREEQDIAKTNKKTKKKNQLSCPPRIFHHCRRSREKFARNRCIAKTACTIRLFTDRRRVLTVPPLASDPQENEES